MVKEKSKKINSENKETANKDEEKIISKENPSEFVDLDWIFDRGWLRTKK